LVPIQFLRARRLQRMALCSCLVKQWYDSLQTKLISPILLMFTSKRAHQVVKLAQGRQSIQANRFCSFCPHRTLQSSKRRFLGLLSGIGTSHSTLGWIHCSLSQAVSKTGPKLIGRSKRTDDFCFGFALIAVNAVYHQSTVWVRYFRQINLSSTLGGNGRCLLSSVHRLGQLPTRDNLVGKCCYWLHEGIGEMTSTYIDS